MPKKKSRAKLPKGKGLTEKQRERAARKRAAYRAGKWLKQNRAVNVKVDLRKARAGKLTKKQEDNLIEKYNYRRRNPGTQLVHVRRKPKEAESTYRNRLAKIKSQFGQEESIYNGVLVHTHTKEDLKYDAKNERITTAGEIAFDDMDGNQRFGEEIFAPLQNRAAVVEDSSNIKNELLKFLEENPQVVAVRPMWTQYAGTKFYVDKDDPEWIADMMQEEYDAADTYGAGQYFSGFVGVG